MYIYVYVWYIYMIFMVFGVGCIYGMWYMYGIYTLFRVSGKPSFMFFSLVKTDVTFIYILLISYYVMSPLTVVDTRPFILSLIWWWPCWINSNCLFNRLLSWSTHFSFFSFKHKLHFLDKRLHDLYLLLFVIVLLGLIWVADFKSCF